MNNKTLICTALTIGLISLSTLPLDINTIVTNAEQTLSQDLLEAKKYIFGIYEGDHQDEYDTNDDGNLNVLDILNMKRDIIKDITTTTTEPPQTTTTTTTTTTQPPQTTTTTTTTTTEPPQTTTTTTTTTVTTPEPEQPLPNKAYISGVTPIVQSGLPTGCEATGLTIALRWYGFSVTKEQMALTYMPRQDFYYADGKKIGADYMTTFAGDPTRKSNSYGCYIPCMVQTVQNYFDDIGETEYKPIDLTGTSLDDVFKYVAQGTPVMVITSNNLVTPVTGDSWYTEDGRYITWQKGHHCMVITGYNYSSNTVTVSESAYSYERTYNMDTFRSVYNKKGKCAMIISKTGNVNPPVSDNYVTPFSDGYICTIRNVGSGKYLNVDYGKDIDETNVYQWTGDGSTEQKFKMDFLSESSCYRIRAMCSSDGEDKTLDIVKSSGNVLSGCNVEIYRPVDQIAQEWLFVSLGNNTYKIVPKYNKNLALTAYGNSNGSANGTTDTSAGNVFVSTDINSSYQKWVVTKIS